MTLPHVRFAANTGEATKMAQVAPGQYNIGEWYTLKLVVSGSDFLGYVNDNLLCTLHDTRFKGKFVDLMISSHTT